MPVRWSRVREQPPHSIPGPGLRVARCLCIRGVIEGGCLLRSEGKVSSLTWTESRRETAPHIHPHTSCPRNTLGPATTKEETATHFPPCAVQPGWNNYSSCWDGLGKLNGYCTPGTSKLEDPLPTPFLLAWRCGFVRLPSMYDGEE